MKTSSAFLNKLEVCGIIHCEVENHMNLSLEDKVILITGGDQWIGAAIVRACGKEGGTPVILDRDEAAIRILQAELPGAP